MINLIFWEDEDRKRSGRNSCCCAIDDTDASGFFDTFYREATFEIAKGKTLDNLKKLRDDIDELIKREIKQKSSTRL